MRRYIIVAFAIVCLHLLCKICILMFAVLFAFIRFGFHLYRNTCTFIVLYIFVVWITYILYCFGFCFFLLQIGRIAECSICCYNTRKCNFVHPWVLDVWLDDVYKYSGLIICLHLFIYNLNVRWMLIIFVVDYCVRCC